MRGVFSNAHKVDFFLMIFSRMSGPIPELSSRTEGFFSSDYATEQPGKARRPHFREKPLCKSVIVVTNTAAIEKNYIFRNIYFAI